MLHDPYNSHPNANGASTQRALFFLACGRGCELAWPARVTSHGTKGESHANGAYTAGSPIVFDAISAGSAASDASKSVALLANIQELLGCTMEEVRHTYFRGGRCAVLMAILYGEYCLRISLL